MIKDLIKTVVYAAVLIFVSCRGKGRFVLHRDVPGPSVAIGELVELTVTEKTEEGAVLWRSADDDRTALIERSLSVFPGDLFAALGNLSEGDSATVKINLDSIVTHLNKPKPNTKGKHLIYDISIHKVIHKDSAARFLQTRRERLKAEEPFKLAAYKTARKIQTTTLPSGLQYMITNAASGPTAAPGDSVAVKYTTRLMSGRLIDSAIHQPRIYISGRNTTIAGLEESIRLFPAHTKATVLIPSSLAFAETGFNGIQPFTPLIYDLEIVNISHFKGKRPTEKGAPLPTFAFTNIANDAVIQKEDVKTPAVIVLFTTDCDHCQLLLENLGRHHAAFLKTHLYLVSSDDPKLIQSCMQRYGSLLLGRKNVIVLHDSDKMAMGTFHASTFPSVYVYNDQQQLLQRFAGDVSLQEITKSIQ